MWPSGALTTFGSRTLTGPADLVDAVQALLGQVERHLHLVQQHLEPGVAVAGGPGDHRNCQLAVGQVRLVAAQVEVEATGAGNRAGDAVRRGARGWEHADADRAGEERLVVADEPVELGQAPPDLADRLPGPGGPAAEEPPPSARRPG